MADMLNPRRESILIDVKVEQEQFTTGEGDNDRNCPTSPIISDHVHAEAADPDRTFSTINIKELLSRIQLLETQVTLCVQNQPLLFEQIRKCTLLEEHVNLMKGDVDKRLVELIKRIDKIGVGSQRRHKTSSVPSPRAPTKPSLPTSKVNPVAFASNLPTRTDETLRIEITEVVDIPPRPLVLVPPTIPGLAPIISKEHEPRTQALPAAAASETSATTTNSDQNYQDRVCPKCGKTFSKGYHMLRHIRVAHAPWPKPQFVCKICGASYSRKEKLKEHQRKAHGCISKELVTRESVVTPCPEGCGLVFKSGRNLLAHVKNCQGRERTTEQADPLAEEPLGSVTEYENAGSSHSLQPQLRQRSGTIKQHFHGTSGTCSVCGKYFTYLYRHMKKIHNSRGPTGPSRYGCGASNQVVQNAQPINPIARTEIIDNADTIPGVAPTTTPEPNTIPAVSDPTSVNILEPSNDSSTSFENFTNLDPDLFEEKFDLEKVEAQNRVPDIAKEIVSINVNQINPLQCKFCPPSPSFIFEDAESLANHYTSGHSIPLRRTIRLGRHRYHASRSNDSQPRGKVCPNCGKAFASRFSMLRHIRLGHHTNRPKDLQGKICPNLNCGKEFASRFSMLRHIRLRHHKQHANRRNDSLQGKICPNCGKEFASRFSMLRHIRLRHHTNRPKELMEYQKKEPSIKVEPGEIFLSTATSATKSPNLLKCKLCPSSPDLIFENAESLANHYTSNHPVPPGKLKLTSTAISNKKIQLQKRRRWKRDGRCSTCGKYFNNLYGHQQTHRPVPERLRHICKTCGTGFWVKRDLQRHELTHTDERPFTCEYCGKSFRLMGHLKVHTRSHHCGKSFRKKATL